MAWWALMALKFFSLDSFEPLNPFDQIEGGSGEGKGGGGWRLKYPEFWLPEFYLHHWGSHSVCQHDCRHLSPNQEQMILAHMSATHIRHLPTTSEMHTQIFFFHSILQRSAELLKSVHTVCLLNVIFSCKVYIAKFTYKG